VLERNFAQSDVFQEADINRKNVKFLYNHRGQYWFSDERDPSKRFELNEELLGDSVKFLKANTVLEAILFGDKIISITLPVKMEFKVVEAPPGIRGDTAQGGVKQVKIDTGATVNAPLFINEGDIITINTETGDYVERAEKGK
jgi:elongation factor P